MNMLYVTVACLLAMLVLIRDAESLALERETRDTIDRPSNRRGFYVRYPGRRNCAGLWMRCMEIAEGSSKRSHCVRGYNKFWCKDLACPGQHWCEDESQLDSNQNNQQQQQQ